MTIHKNKIWKFGLSALAFIMSTQSLIASENTSFDSDEDQPLTKRARIDKEETSELFSQLPSDLNPFLTGDFACPPQKTFFTEMPPVLMEYLFFQEPLGLRDLIHLLSTSRDIHNSTALISLISQKPIASTDLLTFQNLDLILQKYAFQNITIIDQDVPHMFPLLLQNNPNAIRSLSLKGYFSFYDDHLDDAGILPIVTTNLYQFPNLTSLFIGDREDQFGSLVGDDTLKSLKPSLEQMHQLKSLELWGCHLSSTLFRGSLGRIPQLETLTLAPTCDLIGEEDKEELIQTIYLHGSLNKFSLIFDAKEGDAMVIDNLSPSIAKDQKYYNHIKAQIVANFVSRTESPEDNH